MKSLHMLLETECKAFYPNLINFTEQSPREKNRFPIFSSFYRVDKKLNNITIE